MDSQQQSHPDPVREALESRWPDESFVVQADRTLARVRQVAGGILARVRAAWPDGRHPGPTEEEGTLPD